MLSALPPVWACNSCSVKVSQETVITRWLAKKTAVTLCVPPSGLIYWTENKWAAALRCLPSTITISIVFFFSWNHFSLLYSLSSQPTIHLNSSIIHLSLLWQMSPLCWKVFNHLLSFAFVFLCCYKQPFHLCSPQPLSSIRFSPTFHPRIPNHPFNFRMNSLMSGGFTLQAESLTFKCWCLWSL